MALQKHRRRQKVVDANFQLRLGMHLIGWLYLYVVVIAVAVNLPALKSLILSEAADPEYVDAVLAVRGFSRFVLVPLVITFLAMAGHAILLTHRIAGPVFRVKAVLRQMAQRRFPERVTFRTKDFLHDVAEELTVTVQALREDQARMLRMNDETRTAVQRLAELARGGADAGALEAAADEAAAAADRMHRHIASAVDSDTESGEFPDSAAAETPSGAASVGA